MTHPTRRSIIPVLFPIASALAILALACGSDEGPETPAAPPSPEAAAPATKPKSPPAIGLVAPQAAATRAMPPAGELVIEVSEEGFVTLLANEVPRLDILRDLARATGFKVVRQKITEEQAGPVTHAIVDAGIVDVLTQLLDGVKFVLRFDGELEDGHSTLRLVGVGTARAGGGPPRNRMGKRRGPGEGGPGGGRGMLSKEEREAWRAEMAERRANRYSDEERKERMERRREAAEQASRDLDDSDEAVRSKAAGKIDVDDPAELQRLARLMKEDPSEDVRAAAVDRISDSDNATTVMLLLAALDDPSSKVVIQALDGLEFDGDETVIPQIEPIARKHPDPEVREKARDAISFLE